MLCLVIGMFVNSVPVAITLSLLIMSILLALSLSPAGESLIRMQLRLKGPSSNDAKKIQPAMNEILKRADSEVSPNVYVVEQKIPNAFAVGTNTVAVTRGLLDNVTSEELKGVLAHEIGHLENGDTKRRVMALTMNTVGTISAWTMVVLSAALGVLSSIFNRNPLGGFVSIIFGLIAGTLRIAWNVLQKVFDLSLLSIGRQEEFKADEYTIKCNAEAGLISFLNKLKDTNFEQKSIWARLHSTHPPINERISRLSLAMRNEKRSKKTGSRSSNCNQRDFKS